MACMRVPNVASPQCCLVFLAGFVAVFSNCAAVGAGGTSTLMATPERALIVRATLGSRKRSRRRRSWLGIYSTARYDVQETARLVRRRARPYESAAPTIAHDPCAAASWY